MTDSLTFSPAGVSLAVGDTVEWINVGQYPSPRRPGPGRPPIGSMWCCRKMLPRSNPDSSRVVRRSAK